LSDEYSGIPIINNSGETIPPFSIAKVTSVDSNRNMILGKPDATSIEGFVITGPEQIIDGQNGVAQDFSSLMRVRYAGTTPVVGDTLGSVSGVWTANKVADGLMCYGTDAEDGGTFCLVRPFKVDSISRYDNTSAVTYNTGLINTGDHYSSSQSLPEDIDCTGTFWISFAGGPYFNIVSAVDNNYIEAVLYCELLDGSDVVVARSDALLDVFCDTIDNTERVRTDSPDYAMYRFTIQNGGGTATKHRAYLDLASFNLYANISYTIGSTDGDGAYVIRA